MTRQFESALALAKAGYPVFPLHGITEAGCCTCGNTACSSPGKHPALKGWQKAATTNPDQIGKWWKTNPQFNPGIRTGGKLVVLDIDGEEGRKNLHSLEKKFGMLPSTLIVRTGRDDGGEHHYFHSDDADKLGCSIGDLAEHLDIRSKGGYVVGPGSRHATGRFYQWEVGCSPEEIEAADLPTWIPQRLHRKKKDNKAGEIPEKQGFILPDGMIPEGSRDNTLFRYGCYLRGVCGKDMEFIRDELFRVNAEKCDPPLPDEQVRKKIYQIDRYERKGGAEGDFEPSRLICASDVPDEDARFILKPYLPEGQLTLIQGNPGDGKTAFCCWLAAKVSTGQDINGIPCVQGNVLLLSVEDDMPVLKKRFIASGGDASCCFLVSNAAGLTFNSPEIEEYIQEKNIRLVIFDPLQAFLGAKVDMNRANETRPVLAELKEMAQRNSCAVVIISHINKGMKDGLAIQRSLGSMDIPGACRSIMHIGRLDSDPDQRLMVHVKSSNAREGKSIQFTIIHDGGVRFKEFTDKGYANLSELGRKTRTASSNPILLDSLICSCRELLRKNPHGIQVTYDDLGVFWPAGVKPGPLLNSWRFQLEDAGISIITGKRVAGKATAMVMPYRIFDSPDPPQSA